MFAASAAEQAALASGPRCSAQMQHAAPRPDPPDLGGCRNCPLRSPTPDTALLGGCGVAPVGECAAQGTAAAPRVAVQRRFRGAQRAVDSCWVRRPPFAPLRQSGLRQTTPLWGAQSQDGPTKSKSERKVQGAQRRETPRADRGGLEALLTNCLYVHRAVRFSPRQVRYEREIIRSTTC